METVVPKSAVYGYKKRGHRTNSLYNRISDSPNLNLVGRLLNYKGTWLVLQIIWKQGCSCKCSFCRTKRPIAECTDHSQISFLYIFLLHHCIVSISYLSEHLHNFASSSLHKPTLTKLQTIFSLVTRKSIAKWLWCPCAALMDTWKNKNSIFRERPALHSLSNNALPLYLAWDIWRWIINYTYCPKG